MASSDLLASLVDTGTTATGEEVRKRLDAADQAIASMFPGVAFGGDDIMDEDEMGEDDELGLDYMGEDDDLGEDDDFDLMGEDDELGVDEIFDLMGEDDDFGFIPPSLVIPRKVYAKLAAEVTRLVQRGKGGTKGAQLKIAKLYKIWGRISGMKKGSFVAGLQSPDQVLAAAGYVGPRPSVAVGPVRRASRRPVAVAPSVASSPAYYQKPAGYTQASAVAPAGRRGPGPTDTSVAPSQRVGYRDLLGGGRLLKLFRSFPTSELRVIANQTQRDPRVRGVARKVLAERRGATARPVVTQARTFTPAAAPARTVAPVSASTYTPTSRALASGRMRTTTRFGAEPAVVPPGYEATPTFWTSLTSHPVKMLLLGGAVFGAGVYFSEDVKDAVSGRGGRRYSY